MIIWLALILALTVVACDTLYRHAAMDCADHIQVNEAMPVVGPRSWMPWGSAFDARWWVMHAEDARARHDSRLRQTMRDNAPAGREVHWASPVAWGLRALDALAPGVDASTRFHFAIRWFGPVSWLGAAVLLGWLASRAGGPPAAAAMVLGLACCGPVHELFQAGDADHHGLAAMAGAANVLALVLAIIAPVENPSAIRRRALIAGVCGAFGMWLSASTTIPLLAGCGLGAIAGFRVCKDPARVTAMAMAWRAWACAGAMASVGFYLVEYAPAIPAMRLEVNHPVHALAWLGAGWLLARLGPMIADCPSAGLPGGRTGNWLSVAAVAAVAMPIILVLARGEAVFSLSDPFLRAIHAGYIHEFQSLASNLTGGSANIQLVVAYFGWPVLGIAAWLTMWRRHAPGSPWRVAAMLAGSVAVCYEILAMVQMRWVGMASILWLACVVLALAGTLAAGASAPGNRPLLSAGGVPVLLVAGVIVGWYPGDRISRATGIASIAQELPDSFSTAVVLRDLARQIRATSATPALVLADPSTSTELAFHGGLRVVGTLYWENNRGLQDGCRMLAAKDEAEAKTLLGARGITHVVMPAWDPLANPAAAAGLLAGRATPLAGFDGFFSRLVAGGDPPDWLRPYAFPIPPAFGLSAHPLTLYEVRFDQSPRDAAMFRGYYHAERGEWDRAIARFRQVLVLDPDNQTAIQWLAELENIRARDTAHPSPLQ